MIACNFKLRSTLSVNKWWWCGSWIHQYVSILSIHLSLIQQQLLLWFQLCCLRLHLCASIWSEGISICCNYDVRLEKTSSVILSTWPLASVACTGWSILEVLLHLVLVQYPGSFPEEPELQLVNGSKRIINVVLSDALIKAIVAIY